MLNAECTHPSLLSFSYFCFPIDLCYHNEVCELWAQYYEAGRQQWHFFIPEGILSDLQMLKKNDTFQNQLIFQFRLWHTHWRYKVNHYMFSGWLNTQEFLWNRWKIWEIYSRKGDQLKGEDQKTEGPSKREENKIWILMLGQIKGLSCLRTLSVKD